MNTLRLQLRFLLPLAITLVAAAYLALPLLDNLTLRWFARDLNLRGALVTNALSDSIASALSDRSDLRLKNLFARAVQDERLVALGLCAQGSYVARSAAFPHDLTCLRASELGALPVPNLALATGSVHVGVLRVSIEGAPAVDLVLLHDLSFIDRRSEDTQKYLIAFMAALGVVIALITVVVAQLSWRGWLAGARALLRGEGLVTPMVGTQRELAPLAEDFRDRLRDLEDAYRRSLHRDDQWDADRLRALLKSQLRGDELIVVSNREPYIHDQEADGIVCKRPASGLVTAVEPVMRACSGTWIAHGSGSADRQVVDANDRVMVPPGSAEYTLRRIWLTPQEEQGYYYGFANEGLWPLCHVAHVRPVFRESDWKAYRAINERFADAVVAEARSEDPVVLVQDYHFALVPALVRKKLPRATILTFWHIPWPNPEFFSICPWREELLRGLLGSTIVGFHTRYHCKNFLETVERNLETRIEQEHSTVTVNSQMTLVQHYPISIAWPTEAERAQWHDVVMCRDAVRTRMRMPSAHRLAVGVDRFDYTKGILERIHAVERLLEKYPGWIGQFSLLQIAAPSRSELDEYRAFQQRIHAVTERVNQRFGKPGYQPVYLLAQHHGHEALVDLYRAADICLVTSLHDGMNLVCKEFIAARDDEQGVLVLSRFAGAAAELNEALIINPYHVEEGADALHRALNMPAGEQRERMSNLRATVREYNVFRWAGRMLADAAHGRLRERIEARMTRLTTD